MPSLRLPDSRLPDCPMLFVSLDGVGVGAAPDAGSYGDAGSDTLGHVCAAARPHLPNLARLGRIRPLAGVEAVAAPVASWGRMTETTAGKDSTAGHWELAGVVLEKPLPTYPDGFARALEAFDAALPALEAALPEGAVLLLTADHGNDPTHPGSDHTRERVPLLVLKKGKPEGHDPETVRVPKESSPGRALGTRASFADHAASVAAYFEAAWAGPGTAFL